MKDLCTDLRAEYDELAVLCAGFTPQQWALPTGFFHWTPWDEIAHLLYFDQTATQALTDPEAFARHARELNEFMTAGKHISALCRELFGHLDGPALLATWRPAYGALVDKLATFDPKARLPWYGPTMSARSFATARLMECWAHGQDVWDAVRLKRPVNSRLKHIAHLGVTTFGWSFVVRGQKPPGPQPSVELQGPGSEVWTWGDASAAESIRGPALDFCLVVTQRRNPQDTALRISGPTAAAWMQVAQCFAGEAALGPAPGVRKIVYGEPA